MNKVLKIIGISLILLGIVCNQWVLSLVFPSNGFHVAGILEKSFKHDSYLGIFNQELIRTCQADSAEVFDLASEIPHSSEFFYDAMHFNEKGANLVAEKIAGYLQSYR